MRIVAVVVALFGMVAFSKLYLAAPSASDGEKVIAKFVHDRSSGNITLSQFKQTGGKEYMLSGTRIFVMTFEAAIDCNGNDPMPEAARIEFIAYRARSLVSQPLHSGERRVVRGAIQFEKTSYAWVGQPM